ncbi:glycosyltransferase [Litoribaculum gwangyangense]|uniref:Streptomycin biosynthesis protein StrF domain-containing protein n=1 Tax=Litoribaculum gwangyangense TaxID=1130722 RepID=A0ABP9CRE1_9FLAO
MISIIICSRTIKVDLSLIENISSTIGCPYELIVVNNSKNKYSIFQAYNLGLKKSKGNYWCFMHDDILLHTKNWGLKIQEIFENNPKIGLIGVAGAKVKTKMPSAWWDCGIHEKAMHLKQHLENGEVEYWNIGWKESNIEDVVAVDGFFMVARPNENIYFDEDLIGFHNYDLNISLAYKMQNLKVVVTNSILIEHFSFGTPDIDWCKSVINFDKRYRKKLPLQVEGTLLTDQFKRLEFKNGKLFCEKLLTNNLKMQAVYYWLRLVLFKPVSKYHFYFCKRYLKTILTNQ